jgi:ribosomal protein L37AE/L43A
MRRCCCHEIVYGPGSDDYGRDKMMTDWECPQCHEVSRFTRLAIRIGINRCEKCGWMSEWMIMISNKLDKLPRCKDE